MIDNTFPSACHTEQYGTISVTSLLSFNNYFDPRNAAFQFLLVFNDYGFPGGRVQDASSHHNCEQLFLRRRGREVRRYLNNSLVNLTVQARYGRNWLCPGNGQLRQLHAAFHERALSAPLPAPILSRNEDVFRLRSWIISSMSSPAGQSRPRRPSASFDVDADVYLILSLEQTPLGHFVPAGSKTFIYVVSGRIRMDRQILQPGDHCVSRARNGLWPPPQGVAHSHRHALIRRSGSVFRAGTV